MAGDVVKEQPYLFLGSRLKRLAERMQGDVMRMVEQADIPIQPSQYPLLATLDRYGPQTIGELTQAMQQSQPTVTRAASRLVSLGLVEVSRRRRDLRHKTISLTPAGEAALERSKRLVWPHIEAAVASILASLSGSLLDQIAALEVLLDQQPLDQRARATMLRINPTGPATPPPVLLPQGEEGRSRIVPPPLAGGGQEEGSAIPSASSSEYSGLALREFTDELAPLFRDINAEWIDAMYTLEQTDRDVLDQPQARIIDPGGAILFVEAAGLGIVGTCALQKTGEGCFELTKMGVLEAARGRKAGEFLLRAVIARALAMGAEVLYLLSNRKSAAAIHLYEKLGFVHDAEIMAEYGARYARCNVAMRYRG